MEVKRVTVFKVLMMCDTIELLAHVVVVVDATLALNDSCTVKPIDIGW